MLLVAPSSSAAGIVAYLEENDDKLKVCDYQFNIELSINNGFWII
jgi:hypothetical protein